MLRVEGVTAGYAKSPVLHDVSLEVLDGECACLVGANGAGKSTMMYVISGLLKPFSGKVTFDGTDLVGLSPSDIVDLGVIQVPEGRQLFPKMTVTDNLLLGARNKRARACCKQNFERVYGLFPVLAARRGQLAGTLSGGEQQMLAVGRGLMAAPKILLLDEPSIGLAPKLVKEIFFLVKRLVSEGLSTLLVEQNVRGSLTVSSHGFLLERGQITLKGESGQMLQDDVVKKGYIGG